MTATLLKIVEEVKTLGDDERRELKELLQTLEVEASKPSSEEQFARNLAAKGLVSLPTSPLQPATAIPISGKPVSEIMVEERR